MYVKVRQLLVAAAIAASSASMAQSVTKGPIRITTVFPSGSGPDTVARIVADKLQTKWNQPVIVESKPGAAGMVGINAMKNQPATGNDLIVVDVGTLSINPLIFRRLAYDPEKDLTPVAVLYKTAFFVAVSANGPYRTLKDLLSSAIAAQRPLTYGSNAVGGPLHLASERLRHAIGSEMLHIPYKELSQLYASVSTGEVNWAFGSIATAGPLVASGKLRFVAVADEKRSPAMPDVPTLEEAGGPKDLYATTWVALMAPKGTPVAVLDSLNKAVNDALAQPDVKAKFATFGFVASPGPVRQVTDLMHADRVRYAEVVKRINVSLE